MSKETQGNIHISHTVECPYCGYNHDDHYDKDWFEETMGGDFLVDNGYDQDYDAVCEKCGKAFLIKKFVY